MKDWLHLMDWKHQDAFLHEAETLSQFLACGTQQQDILPQLQSTFSVSSMNKEVTASHTSMSD